MRDERDERPTSYEQIERRNAQLESDVAQLEARLKEQALEVQKLRDELSELKRTHDDEDEPGVALTPEELHGERWREFFLTSDVFREHIEPQLEKPWKAVLKEACRKAWSRPVPRGPTKRMKVTDTLSSLPLLLWCRDRGLSVAKLRTNGMESADNLSSCTKAASLGRLDVLKYLHELSCPWNEFTCSMAAIGGHLDVLKYLHENGCTWDEWTCLIAASGGHLDMLKYAHENGCPWDERTCWQAAFGGHLDMLKYARENGCPWNVRTCIAAAEGGHLNVLKYLHENGCPWNEGTCEIAVDGGHLDVLKYAHENGCSWNKKYCHISAKSKGYVDIVAWIASLAPEEGWP